MSVLQRCSLYTQQKVPPCRLYTQKYPYGLHETRYQAHGARKDDNSKSHSCLVEVFDSQTTFSLFFFQLNGDQTLFTSLHWLFWQNRLGQISLFITAITYYSEVNTARSMDHFHGAVEASLQKTCSNVLWPNYQTSPDSRSQLVQELIDV